MTKHRGVTAVLLMGLACCMLTSCGDAAGMRTMVTHLTRPREPLPREAVGVGYVVGVDEDGGIAAVCLRTGEKTTLVLADTRYHWRAVAFDLETSTLYATDDLQGQVVAWTAASLEPKTVYRYDKPVDCLCLSPSGRRVYFIDGHCVYDFGVHKLVEYDRDTDTARVIARGNWGDGERTPIVLNEDTLVASQLLREDSVSTRYAIFEVNTTTGRMVELGGAKGFYKEALGGLREIPWRCHLSPDRSHIIREVPFLARYSIFTLGGDMVAERSLLDRPGKALLPASLVESCAISNTTMLEHWRSEDSYYAGMYAFNIVTGETKYLGAETLRHMQYLAGKPNWTGLSTSDRHCGSSLP